MSKTQPTLIACLIAHLIAAPPCPAETLHNGIVLPDVWPPNRTAVPDDAILPPYLKSPPPIIPVNIGRQLFVDDFLIEFTTLKRTFHTPQIHPASPVLKPEKPWEIFGSKPGTMPFSDGVWWDPKDRLFKMWYYAGHGAGQTCYATSKDGLSWDRPELDVVPGTNIVLKGWRDSNTVWLDHQTKNPEERFKMAVYSKGSMLSLLRSNDGIHWTPASPGAKTGDRSTFFQDPFRNRWVFSIRSDSKRGRSRDYWDSPDFFAFSDASTSRTDPKNPNPPVPWTASDTSDSPRDDLKSRPQLYNLDCAPYESLTIGLFSIWKGDYRGSKASPEAQSLDTAGRPKQNSLYIGFSRDGFHWDRSNRSPFVSTSEKYGDWNWGNVQSVGGGCTIVGDQLRFYVSGRAGKSRENSSSNDASSSTGIAVLRRDGFASMDAPSSQGTLTTRPIQFSGKYLFVNLVAPNGQLRAEILEPNGNPIPPFTLEASEPISGDSTKSQLRWKGTPSLDPISNKPVKIRFHLSNGSLHSFWISQHPSGTSNGFVAAGGPEFTGATDSPKN